MGNEKSELDALRMRILALEEALADQRARGDAHLLMIVAIFRGLQAANIEMPNLDPLVRFAGIYNTAVYAIRKNEQDFVKENAQGALIRELQLVLKEVFEQQPYGKSAP